MIGDELDRCRRTARPGRGAASNRVGRFEPYARVAVDDGWDLEEEARVLRTEVAVERPRSVITRNTSPDVGFDRSINPYRGCEHGCIYCFARPTHAYPRPLARPRLRDPPRRPARGAAGAGGGAGARAPTGRRRSRSAPTPTPTSRSRSASGSCAAILEVLRDFRHPVTVSPRARWSSATPTSSARWAARASRASGVSVTTLDRERRPRHGAARRGPRAAARGDPHAHRRRLPGAGDDGAGDPRPHRPRDRARCSRPPATPARWRRATSRCACRARSAGSSATGSARPSPTAPPR